MELITEPDLYAPSVNDAGNYVDKIPPFASVKSGLRCPCGSRKDKTYDTYSTFSAHIKTKAHQKWLEGLNMNKSNMYVENQDLRNTVQNQRLIIAKMEKELQNKSMTIDYLTMQVKKAENNTTNTIVSNLIDFDE